MEGMGRMKVAVKNIILLVSAMAVMGLAACSGAASKDDPEKKYRDLGLVPVGSQGADTGREKEKVIVTVEKPVEVPKYYPVEDPELVISQNLIQVLDADNVTFVEGQAKTVKFSVKILRPDVSFKVSSDEVTLTTVSETPSLNTYSFSYTAPVGSVTGTDVQVDGSFKLKIDNIVVKSTDAKTKSDTETALNAIEKTREVPFRILRNGEKPTIKVVGLDANTVINYDKAVNFSVEVTAPGGYVGNEPQLFGKYNHDTAITANGFEDNGGIIIDPRSPAVEKIGANVWRFNYTIDPTKYNLPVPLDKNMKPVVNPTKLFLRDIFVAVVPFAAPSDEKLVQFSITLKPQASQNVTTGEKQ